MSQALIELALFTSKSLIVVMFVLIVLITFFALLAKGKEKLKGRLTIKNLNQKYAETTEELLTEILPKKILKKTLKDKKKAEKEKAKSEETQRNLFVLN